MSKASIDYDSFSIAELQTVANDFVEDTIKKSRKLHGGNVCAVAKPHGTTTHASFCTWPDTQRICGSIWTKLWNPRTYNAITSQGTAAQIMLWHAKAATCTSSNCATDTLWKTWKHKPGAMLFASVAVIGIFEWMCGQVFIANHHKASVQCWRFLYCSNWLHTEYFTDLILWTLCTNRRELSCRHMHTAKTIIPKHTCIHSKHYP